MESPYQDGINCVGRHVADVKLDDSQIDPLLRNYTSGPSVRTISREGDRLYSQVTGQPKFELGASSGTELYVNQWNAQLTVVKGRKRQGDELSLAPKRPGSAVVESDEALAVVA